MVSGMMATEESNLAKENLDAEKRFQAPDGG